MSINIKDIKNKDKCIKNDISNISENKGILLALLYFILKKYKHLINLKININLSKYQKILKLLFSDLKFSSSTADFNININTKEIGNLNIKYINLLEEINAKKIYIVPWFDGDNPLIMFMKSNNKQDIHKINKKIVDWHNCSRTQPHNKFNNYDEFIENNILNKYIKFNNKWSYDDLITYINTSLSNQIIINKTIEKKIQVPVPTPYLVPMPIPTNITTQNTNQNTTQNTNQNTTQNINNINFETTVLASLASYILYKMYMNELNTSETIKYVIYHLVPLIISFIKTNISNLKNIIKIIYDIIKKLSNLVINNQKNNINNQNKKINMIGGGNDLDIFFKEVTNKLVKIFTNFDLNSNIDDILKNELNNINDTDNKLQEKQDNKSELDLKTINKDLNEINEYINTLENSNKIIGNGINTISTKIDKINT
jgi:hypothetical protein